MDTQESMPTSDARANLSDVIAQVRILRRSMRLTRRDKPQAALVPVELADAADDVGGPDAAVQILRDHMKR